jgi:hypothetical protein
MSDYQRCIATMQQLSGVTAVGVFNNSGQLLSATPGMSADVGAVAVSMFANLGVQIKRMQRGLIRRILLESTQGVTLLSGLADGNLMIVFVDSSQGLNLSKLMELAAPL